MLLIKIRNAGELLWDSLDTQERKVLVYLAAYAIVAVLSGLQRSSRERLRRELRAELGIGVDRAGAS